MPPDSEPGPDTRELEDLLRKKLGADANQPEQVGPYRILQVIGEGGMGTVYHAEQREPVKRRVALKLIKLGMDTKAVLARFSAERQALSMMEHSNIARVYDAGTSDRGQPYFAMEYIKGIPITEYCDQNNLSLAERIQLFRQVCSGVQHAHLKGVMHRDLKPGNVLVTVQDGKPVPKIIDFGLAKAVDHRLVEATLFTEFGQPIGTPQYMSPEQAGLEGLDIDTRTDVYSLGVLLYELLSGDLPFRSNELRQAGNAEMQRIIRETDPPKPSTRVTTLGGTVADVARHRGVAVAELQKSLRGDLDWIVMKAMEKDRTRRYETALELAADLERHLQNEPVLASPPSLGYRVAKFVRRNRGQVVAGALVFAALVGGTVTTYLQYRDAREQKVIAEDSATRAEQLAKEALKETERADKENLKFTLTAATVALQQALGEVDDLYPAVPGKTQAMRDWLDKVGHLLAMRPEIERTQTELRSRALPRSPADVARDQASHLRHEEWASLQKKVAALQRAQSMRESPRSLVIPRVSSDPQGNIPASAWNALAWERVAPPVRDGQPEERRLWGEEDYGLAYAEAAVRQATAASRDGKPDPDIRTCDVLDTLAWALFANGQDEEARKKSKAATEDAPEEDRGAFDASQKRLEAAIQSARADLAAAEAELSSLTSEVSAQRSWRFEDPANQFLHDTLTQRLATLDQLRQQQAAVEQRLLWATKAVPFYLQHAKWDEAARDLATADDVAASKPYAADRSPFHPIHLKPQEGLVPIGRNPVTKLWEFYDLRSAWDGESDPTQLPIPAHNPDGTIPVRADTGVVFVLVPGGSYLMGSQSEHPDRPNYDPHPVGNETANWVVLAPFFLARHELTQGQWKRLVGGELPCYFKAGNTYMADAVTRTNPVEQVSWDDCDLWLRRYGLDLPTEAQWEYGCRAGTTGIWWTGDTVESLDGFANVLDKFGSEAQPDWGKGANFSDGHMIHAPVGSFRANPFGLFDTHGNVFEWCRDEKYDYKDVAARTGDGLRISSTVRDQKVMRGGASDKLRESKSAFRHWASADTRAWEVGVRPARALQQ